jgi:hypothetical protein
VDEDRMDRLNARGLGELRQVVGAAERDGSSSEEGVGIAISDLPGDTVTAEIMVEFRVGRRKSALEVVASLQLDDIRLSRNHEQALVTRPHHVRLGELRPSTPA